MTNTLWLFLTATLLTSASPGPVMLACMNNAARFGIKRSLHTALGASLGNLTLILLSAIGLSVLMGQSQHVLTAIKWIGASYLCYLGICLWKAPSGNFALQSNQTSQTKLFTQAYVIAVTNPKGLIYFGALFPQFIAGHQSIAAQYSLLILLFLIIDLSWMGIYMGGGKSLVKWLSNASREKFFNRATGTIFIGMAISLIAITT
jgi:homoserine/homoserine lactone efflux protein